MRPIIATALWATALACSYPALADDPPKLLQLELAKDVKLDLVLVPAGEFMMGAPEAEQESQPAEGPQHKVTITKPFYMGKFEITNAQMRAFRPDWHSQYLDGDNQPALWASWYDADAFCRWLSEKAKRNVRLPSEAQWEYACRAGTTTRFYTGDTLGKKKHMDSVDLPKAAWYGANSKGVSQDVGKLAANAFGLYDMHGNAWEWCADWYDADYYKSSPAADPAGPEKGRAKVLRGGSYLFWETYYCRSDSRYAWRPDGRESVTGFRVIVDAEPYAAPPAPSDTQPWPAPREMPEVYRPKTNEERRAGGLSITTVQEGEVFQKFGWPATTSFSGIPKSLGGEPKIAVATAKNNLAPAPFQFRFLNGRSGLPEGQTVAWVFSDEEKINFGFACLEPEMDRLTIRGKNRDQNIRDGDYVGILLDPFHKQTRDELYFIGVNPNGVIMDSKGGDAAWNPNVKVEAEKRDSGWTVSVILPLADLGIEKGKIPTVMGMNLIRHRPEIASRKYGKPRLGTLVPHTWPTDDPDLFRPAEDTGWVSPISPDAFNPTRLGHLILPQGTVVTPPPEKLFELLAREDFSNGTKGKMSQGAVEDGDWMGGHKCLRFNYKDGATMIDCPMKDFREAQIIAVLRTDAMKMPATAPASTPAAPKPGQMIYWHTFGKIWGDNKCCAEQVTTLCPEACGVHPLFTYCDGAGRMDCTSLGVADLSYAGFRRQLNWFSEPNIGQINFAGTKKWAVAYTRVGEMITQHPHVKRVDPEKDEVPGWFFHPAGKYDILISEVVIFKGVDNQPPEQVKNVKARIDGDKAILSWDRSADNTLTIWYKITAGTGADAKTVAEVADLSVTLPADQVKGKPITIQAVDFFDNSSTPSEPITAK